MANIAIPKGKVPLYAETQNNLTNYATLLKALISTLLIIKDDPQKEKSLDLAIHFLLDDMRRGKIEDVFKMVKMYADNKLDIEPRENHFNRVVAGHVIASYKRYLRTMPKETNEYDKDLHDQLNVIAFYDDWVQRKREIPIEMAWLYEYFVITKKCMPEPLASRRKFAYELFLDQLTKTPYETKEEYNQRVIDNSKLDLVANWLNKISAQGKHIKDYL